MPDKPACCGRMNRRRLDVEAWRDAIARRFSGKPRLHHGRADPWELSAGSTPPSHGFYAKISRHNLDRPACGWFRLPPTPTSPASAAPKTTDFAQQQLFVPETARFGGRSSQGAGGPRVQREANDDVGASANARFAPGRMDGPRNKD